LLLQKYLKDPEFTNEKSYQERARKIQYVCEGTSRLFVDLKQTEEQRYNLEVQTLLVRWLS
jgi:hypothetical protein